MPWRGTRKAVLWRRRRVPIGAEPRKDDRDATANCPARHKCPVRAGEQKRPLTRRLPGGHLRSLQVKLARQTVERNRSLDKPVFRFAESENPRNAKFGIKFLGSHHNLLSCEVIVADWRATAPGEGLIR
jgi:hypothetical protein